MFKIAEIKNEIAVRARTELKLTTFNEQMACAVRKSAAINRHFQILLLNQLSLVENMGCTGICATNQHSVECGMQTPTGVR